MALEGCYTCIKYLMFAFNFLFWLLGCTVLAIGIWIKVDPSSLQEYTGDDEFEAFLKELNSYNFLSIGAYVLIVVGSVIMLIGFLGCCGAIRESQCMLCSFFILLFIIFSVLVAIGVFTIIKKEKLREELSNILKKKIEEVKQNNQRAIDFMKFVQEKFECCGADNGSIDYGTGFLNNNCSAVNYFKGCTPRVYEKLSHNFVIIAGVAVGIAAVLFLGMIFSMLLCCAIRETSEGGKY